MSYGVCFSGNFPSYDFAAVATRFHLHAPPLPKASDTEQVVNPRCLNAAQNTRKVWSDWPCPLSPSNSINHLLRKTHQFISDYEFLFLLCTFHTVPDEHYFCQQPTLSCKKCNAFGVVINVGKTAFYNFLTWIRNYFFDVKLCRKILSSLYSIWCISLNCFNILYYWWEHALNAKTRYFSFIHRMT